ncbi:protein artemis-like [Galleria mellonella]|uniref:Protein artemis n=1 Tax=Galleria mellonella TaxID=7137 RepID=A0A6J1WHJ9_GALME|nr:protein artemis-like [Galleria mellonella]XP_026753754.2 protein artemis-like [Galleria mellonella]
MCSTNISKVCLSSFGGRIDEIPGICVDNFNIINRSAYFLSHCHTDHTEGLYSDELLDSLEENVDTYIYVSEMTALIVEHEKYELKKYLKVLKLGEPTLVMLRSMPEENIEECVITVTAIPAGHSLGSNMFLFQTNNKTILYTGDFRISPNDIKKHRDFHSPQDRNEPIHLDTMYIDTTFLNGEHNVFMRRTEVIDYLTSEIKSWLDRDSENRVALSLSAKYGYESVFNEIYKRLRKKVYVNDKIWSLYRKMPDRVIGVTNDETKIRIHVCHNKYSHYHHRRCVPNSPNANYLYVRLSAMKWQNCSLEEVPFKSKDQGTRLDVCFSTHCSRSELVHFVNYFSPKKVVGFPNPYPQSEGTLVRKNMSDFQFLPKKRRHRR